MSSFDPYEAPRGDPARLPLPSPPTCRTTALVAVVASAIGFMLGGIYGYRVDRAVAQEAARRSEVIDYLPLMVPTFGLLGAIAGAAIGPLLLGIWACLTSVLHRRF